ncbi:hypothetical protein G809_03930, partial [Escherichia coli HVH 151 (4-5755573)]
MSNIWGAVHGASYQAYVESNLPAPGGSHPHELQMQKSLLAE